MSEYETQANAFLTRFGLEIKTAFKGNRCPPWDDGKHLHGDCYRVTLKRRLRDVMPAINSVSFNFWNSLHAKQERQELTNYDVLSCIACDATMPTSAEEICAEFGYNADSRKEWAQALKAATFAAKLQAFFTFDEIEALREIQ